MKNLVKTAVGMLLMAIVLIAISTAVMRAHAGAPAASSSASVSSETRTVDAGVINIVMNGPIDLVLRQAATPELMVRGESSMLSRVTTRIEGNTLYIGTRGMFVMIRQPLQLEMALPALEKLQMQGSGDASVKGFRGKKIDVSIRGSGDLQFDSDFQDVLASIVGSGDMKMALAVCENVDISVMGSGDVMVKGQTKVLRAKLSGSGNLDAAGLKSNQASISLSGSSDAKITATQEIKGQLSGSGDVRVYGNPAKRQLTKSGSGDIYWQ
ncbi:head GIN domain-containing protein [Undibacterium sp. RuTC16W]|uniref:head GIN domain-containing protein n=1 Tax=Undibacterium sp. RuTC16W TaxID=3413048 RepID=UPI003BF05153